MTESQIVLVDDSNSGISPEDLYFAQKFGAIGSSVGLIYGILNKKRWWVVLLLMAGGAGVGSGVGYVIKAKK